MLNELVESFIRQDFTECELVILNDCAEQTLWINNPRVSVRNFPSRFAFYGDKLNYALSIAKHPLVCVWDDDDIYLPNFISRMYSLLPRFRHGRAAKPALRWTNVGKRYLRLSPDGWMNCVLCERDLLVSLGGFARVHYSVEVELLHKLVKSGWLCGPQKERQECPQYIYRIPSGRLHMTDVQTEEIHDRLRQDFLAHVNDGSEPTGVIEITPKWEDDYIAMAEESWERYGKEYANDN